MLKHHPAVLLRLMLRTQRNHRQTESEASFPARLQQPEERRHLSHSCSRRLKNSYPCLFFRSLWGLILSLLPPAADSTWGIVLRSHPSCRGRLPLPKQMFTVPGELLSWQLPLILGEWGVFS